MKIAVIGGGNMGGALARGLAQGSIVKTENICVSNPSRGKLDALKKEYPKMRVTTSNAACVKDADLVVLAVKPWIVKGVIEELGGKLRGKAIASMVGGMSLDELADLVATPVGGRRDDFDDICAEKMPPLFCLIPNTAIAVRQSMTFFCSRYSTTELDTRLLEVLKELGDAMQVRPDQMAGSTALASCGIAYAMRYIRAATEGGVQLGFYAHDAQQIVMQTLRGAVELLAANGSHPEAEIDRVTTPGGITIRGLNAMEQAGFTPTVIAGLLASRK